MAAGRDSIFHHYATIVLSRGMRKKGRKGKEINYLLIAKDDSNESFSLLSVSSHR
jgi:hypothetical protein